MMTSIQRNNHQDVAVIKYEGGQILVYLGQHYLLIQTKLIEKTYVKFKLWQQEELVGRIKVIAKDISRVIGFSATMNNSTISLQLYYRSYDIIPTHQQNLEQKETAQLTPQKPYLPIYVNKNTIYISQQRKTNLQILIIIKKNTDLIYEGVLPVTHKISKGHYKDQFKKQIVFSQEWYTYMVWRQTLSIQTE